MQDSTSDFDRSGKGPRSRAEDSVPPRGGVVADLTHNHYPRLDGLRGLAILLVMVYHFSLPHPRMHGHDAGWALQLAQGGWLGVDLFFVLSGFLITGILVQTRKQDHYFRNFLGRRFLRIWPLYYMSLLVLLVLLPLVLPSVPPQLRGMQDKQAWFWLYGANWLFAREGSFGQTSGGYLWSLAVEEQFYIAWPLVVYALSDRSLLRLSLVLLGLSLLSRVVLINLGVSTGALYTMTFTHWDGLAVGSCLAICARSPTLMARVARWLPIIALPAAGGLLAVRLTDGDAFMWSRQMATFGYSLAAVLFGALLVWVQTGKEAAVRSRFFTTRFMRQCGKYSYALYVFHVPVAGVTFPVTMRALARVEPIVGYEGVFLGFVAVSFVVSWILAVLSWNLFEKRILALKRYFSYDSVAGAPAQAASGARSAVNMPRG
jgi:peptidoglycan/LPS O-acetylase OafA/YrhL